MLEPTPLLARAWAGDQLIAESRNTVIEHRPDDVPLLRFPLAEVDVGELPSDAWSASDGHLTFYPGQVCLELLEALGPDPDDLTSTGFPHWGDAEHLIEILDVQPSGPDRFTSVTRADLHRPVVEGSQMLAQAMVAALRRAPGRRVSSAHMVFLKIVDARQPYDLVVEDLSLGRTFSTFGITVVQGERRCAAGIVQAGVTAADLVRHEDAGEPCVGPADSVALDMGMTGRDVRIVDAAYTNDPAAPVGPPVIDAWVRFRALPEDQVIHTALLAQLTGSMTIAAALRPHAGIGQDQAHRTISTAPTAITIAMHADVRSDEWIRFHQHATQAGDGMTHAECRCYDEAGTLLASFTVESMLREMTSTPKTADHRTAM